MIIPSSIKTALANFGMPVLTSADDTVIDPIEPDYPVIWIPVPAGQVDTLLEEDGGDPSHIDNNDPVPTGGGLRRLLSLMRKFDLIITWHCFEDPDTASGYACHIYMNLEHRRFWRRWLNTASVNYKVQASKDNLHRWY